MEIIYYSLNEDTNSGVGRKIISQVSNLNILCVDAVIADTNTYKKTYLNHISIYNISKNLTKLLQLKFLIQSSGNDVIIYSRGVLPTPFHLFLFKQKRNCKIVIEFQTIEKIEKLLNDELKIKNKIYFIGDALFAGSIRRCSDAIIGVTDEITQYQLSRAGDPNKPHITIGNGFDVASAPIRHPPPDIQTTLHLLCVANVSRWHGLDRLLHGIAAYQGTPTVILHIAGEGAELPHLQELTTELKIEDRVIFHGFMTGEALDALFNECHIAVGSLGIHRIGLKEASILKAREYCARGIPFIYGIPDPDFPPDFPFILQLPPDETPIDIKQVIAFAEDVCADPDHPQKMRSYAEEHLDWSVKMKRLKGFLEELVGEKEETKG